MIAKEEPKIIVLNWMDILNPNAGGQEKYVYEICRRLANDGYNVIWVTSRAKGMPKTETYNGIHIIRTGNIYTYFVSYFSYYFKVKKNALFFLSMNSIPFLLPLKRARRIVMFHHRIDFKVIKGKIGLFGYFVYFLQEHVNPFLFKNDHIITNSQSSKEDFMQLGYKNINVIKLGVNISNNITMEKKKIIVSPGPIKPWKHHDMVIKAFSQLSDDYNLVIFGSFESNEYKDYLSLLCSDLGISERVKFLGRISDEDIDNIFAESRMCVLGTEKEGWGLVAMEAQSYGCPVVAFDVSGIRESVLNGKTGLLVKYGDIDSMAEAMEKIAYNEDLFHTMSVNGINRSKEYSWDICYKEFLTELKKIEIKGYKSNIINKDSNNNNE